MSSLQNIFSMVSKAFFQIAFLVTVSAYTIPLVSIIIITVSRLYFFQRPAQRKIRRLTYACVAPGFSFIQSCILGKSVIKAFGKEEEFCNYQVQLYRKEVIADLAEKSINKWYRNRIKLIALLLKSYGMALCIMKKGALGLESVTLILVMQYTSEMHWIWNVFSRS